MKKNYQFHVNGMHCKSCVVVTEGELSKVPNVVSAKTSLNHHSVEIVADFGDLEMGQILVKLNRALEGRGYSLSLEKISKKANWSEFKVAAPAALMFILLFIILQKIGLVNLVGGGQLNYGTAFMVGVIASLSSCMAVIGGLLLSMSATFAKEGETLRPQVLFHVGRLVSFFVLGGVIGSIGSVFTLSNSMTFILNLLIGTVMLVLGINLLDVFHSAKKFQFSMPRFLAKYAYGVAGFKYALTPFLVGVATFFLPCGFTQSMQLYTLSTGSFLKGALIMSVFALGTLPVLALISFSSLSINNSPKSGIFFKAIGLIVIAFAIFNLINSLVVIGIINPVFNF